MSKRNDLETVVRTYVKMERSSVIPKGTFMKIMKKFKDTYITMIKNVIELRDVYRNGTKDDIKIAKKELSHNIKYYKELVESFRKYYNEENNKYRTRLIESAKELNERSASVLQSVKNIGGSEDTDRELRGIKMKLERMIKIHDMKEGIYENRAFDSVIDMQETMLEELQTLNARLKNTTIVPSAMKLTTKKTTRRSGKEDFASCINSVGGKMRKKKNKRS